MACAPLDLERADVDLHYGIRYDQESSAEAFPKNISDNDLPSALLVEVPVQADSNGLPSIPALNFAPLAETGATDLHLAFGSITDTLLFPEDQSELAPDWFPNLLQVLDTFLQSCSPKKVILGNYWEQTLDFEEEWKLLLEELKKKYPQVEFGLGWVAAASIPDFVGAGDFLALEYPPLNEPKREAMSLNQELGGRALELGLPVYVYRANLMGKDKPDQLRNILRFWPDEVEVQGVVLNSIYDRIPSLDSSSYFGIVRDQPLQDFLEEYLAR